MISNLSTPNLFLKPVGMEHCTDTYVSWLNDPEVNQFLETRGGYNIHKLTSFLQQILESEKVFFWAIHVKDSGSHIGNIKIDPIDLENGVGEYGILIGDRQVWGRGYAKEASIAVIDFCFSVANLRKITLGVVENNVNALALYYKLGFKKEGLLLRHKLYDGEYLNIVRMALFNESYGG